jgi:Holliday junction resolvase RusA-like endonuclease
MQKEANIKFTGHLPSVNHMYGRNGSRTFLKAEGKAIKAFIAHATSIRMERDLEVGYKIDIFANWYNKDAGKKRKDPKTGEYKVTNRIKPRDTNNLIKLILDACCEALEIDDKQIFREKINKIQSDTEGFEIDFFTLPRYDADGKEI